MWTVCWVSSTQKYAYSSSSTWIKADGDRNALIIIFGSWKCPRRHAYVCHFLHPESYFSGAPSHCIIPSFCLYVSTVSRWIKETSERYFLWFCSRRQQECCLLTGIIRSPLWALGSVFMWRQECQNNIFASRIGLFELLWASALCVCSTIIMDWVCHFFINIFLSLHYTFLIKNNVENVKA